jgi:hypothetical protein
MEDNNKKTTVITKNVNYNRTGYLILDEDKVIFDTSDTEYGPVIFDIKLLEKRLEEHKKKLNE